jgi:uncharacterized protein with FMN-binding domain
MQMFTRTFVLSAVAVAVAAVLTASSPQAWSSPNRTNHLTFTRAVALPGVVLVPGSYTFQAGPEDSNLNVVRVMTRDGRRVLFMGLTIPVTRPADTSGTQVSFEEAPAGQPPPIKEWYPAHSSMGYRFRY